MANDQFDFDKETPAEKFKRLGNSRLTKALDAIALLESLSNKAAYEYSPEQVRVIVELLDEAVQNVEEAFKKGGPVVRERKFL